MIKLAKCCNPVPGDEIIGFITKGRGISVHRCDCSNIVSLPEEEKARFIDVEWEVLEAGKSYEATITIIGTDRRGMLSDISKACDNLDVNLSGVNARTGKDGSLNMTIQLEISSTQEMDRILRALKSIEGISNVYRARS
jgi:GTP pyrophosphokinase